MPLCGLAIGEAERGLPDVNKRLRALLVRVGLEQDAMVVRMTGCPNGCARPYMAEIGFVCDGPNSYQVGGAAPSPALAAALAAAARHPKQRHLQPALELLRPPLTALPPLHRAQIYLGGNSNQTRLASLFADRVKLRELEATLEPVFTYYKASRKAGEGFGDFCERVGMEALRRWAAAARAQAEPPATLRVPARARPAQCQRPTPGCPRTPFTAQQGALMHAFSRFALTLSSPLTLPALHPTPPHPHPPAPQLQAGLRQPHRGGLAAQGGGGCRDPAGAGGAGQGAGQERGAPGHRGAAAAGKEVGRRLGMPASGRASGC
jgi:hypothetical protein